MAPALFELVVEVAPSFADAASASLFGAGVTGLEERRSGKRVRLITWSEQRELLLHWGDIVERELGTQAAAVVEVRRSADTDWATRWTRDLKPVKLGRRFVVRPTKIAQRRARRRQNEILVVPRLAFGLGDHPSTRLAAGAVERWAHADPDGKLLDVGCGTGLLCFVGVLSGAARAVGIDIDPVAIDNARENAALNGLTDRCVFRRKRADEVRLKWDFAVANIDLAALLALAGQLARLSPRVALTGIFEHQAEQLAAAYGRCGFSVERMDSREGWAVLTLAQRAGRRDRWAGRRKVATTRRARGS